VKTSEQKSQTVIYLAAIVIILAGMKVAAPVIVPFLLAMFIAIISAPILISLKRYKVPTSISILLVMGFFLFLAISLGSLIAESIGQFYQDVPTYSEKLQNLQLGLLSKINSYGIPVDIPAINHFLDPKKAITMIGSVFSGLSSALTNTFLIVFFVVFILMEASSLPEKAREAFGAETQSIKKFQQFSDSVKKYLIIKTLVSLGTGLSAWLCLWLIGVDYPILWGLLAFLLNFIPNIGSILAAIPPMLLALVQIGLGAAFGVAISYIIINTVFGNLIEPKVMGQTLGMSAFVVFTSLVFWGWLLGPVGMLLSIPLTMVVKIAMDNSKDHHWIAVLLDK
jgi:predicted PurR-regulated permease PerM